MNDDRDRSTTRRYLLATIGAGGTAIGSIPAAAGQSKRGSVTTSANGVVIQFDDCYTAHVRGRPQDAERVVCQVFFLRNGETIVGGVTVFVEPELPLTITGELLERENHFYGRLDPLVFRSVRVTTLDRETLATLRTPDNWNCHQIVFDAAEGSQ